MKDNLAKWSRFLGYGITFFSFYLTYQRDFNSFGFEELEIIFAFNKEMALKGMILVGIICAADFFHAFTKYKLPAIILYFSASIFLVDWWYDVRGLENVGVGTSIMMCALAIIFFLASVKLSIDTMKMRLRETEVS
ncbi:hypothetical protein DS745_02135 [Anaerobacillus alkaliphilus]|uniref:Uncharacterized protein n=1 Tax=Anaerobacillus alkaliphilus TaxID=1548597 RepID=A0A4Q0VYN9_9BACI|nr:hypothetical protein [Anaerobacillus alkaliphilus]RXJ04208.1 hypothetical protein DS745_02135 [Anaerobacillus alkaliphilus]